MSDVPGTAREMGGRVQEMVGELTGDAKTQAEGLYNQAAGQTQQKVAPPQRPDQGAAHGLGIGRSRHWLSAGTSLLVTDPPVATCYPACDPAPGAQELLFQGR
jgi:uncharacterized protein YjbJ (UPF0337 family)